MTHFRRRLAKGGGNTTGMATVTAAAAHHPATPCTPPTEGGAPTDEAVQFYRTFGFVRLPAMLGAPAATQVRARRVPLAPPVTQ